MNPQPAGASVTTGPLANRFRLAGTFFLYAPEGATAESQRRAIVDDLQKSQQSIVTEGDMLDEYRVQNVYPDRIVLRSGGTEYTLALSFTDPGPVASTSPAGTSTGTARRRSPWLTWAKIRSLIGTRASSARWLAAPSPGALRWPTRMVMDGPTCLHRWSARARCFFSGASLTGPSVSRKPSWSIRTGLECTEGLLGAGQDFLEAKDFASLALWVWGGGMEAGGFALEPAGCLGEDRRAVRPD